MLRQLHRRLRLIHYYSASRNRTAWTTAMDVALVVSLLLAPFVAALSGLAQRGPVREMTADGALGRLDDGQVAATIGDPDGGGLVAPGEPIGDFSLTLAEQGRGWPITTSVETDPLEVILDIYREPTIRRDAQLAEDDPYRVAIEAALRRGGSREILEAWRSGPPPTRHRRLAWVVMSAVWWVLLWAASAVAIQSLAYGSRIRRGRLAASRADLLSTGRCGRCGYDLRGLEFSERCPECGELQE